jgi:hypothetical protein
LWDTQDLERGREARTRRLATVTASMHPSLQSPRNAGVKL